MIKIDSIIVSPNSPLAKNVGWYDGKYLKIFNNGKWGDVLGRDKVKDTPVEEYSKLQYVEGSKNQVIKTDLIIDEHDTIECDYEFTDFGLTVSGDKFLFNCRGVTNNYRVKFSTYSSNKKVYLRFGTDTDTVVTEVLNENTQKGTVMMRKGLCTINDTEIAQLDFVAMPDGPIQLFSNTGSYVKIFEFRIIRDNKIIHKLVPHIKNANNEVGYLDVITNKFYSNDSESTAKLLYKEIPIKPVIDDPTLESLFHKEKFTDSMFLSKTKDFLIKNGTNEYGEPSTFALLSTTKNARCVGFEMKDGHRYKIKVANNCPDSTTWRMRIGVWEESIDDINFVPAEDDDVQNISYYKGTPAKEVLVNSYQTLNSFETIYENVNNYKSMLMLLGWSVDYSYITVSIVDLDENDLSEAVQITNDNISDSVRRELLTPWNRLTKKPMTDLDKLTLTNVLTGNMSSHNKATQAIMELAYDFWKHRDEFMYCDKTPRDNQWDYWSTTGFYDVNTGSTVTEENAGYKRIDCSTFVYYVTSGIGYYSSPYYNTLELTTVEQGALTSAGKDTTSSDQTICRTGKMQIRTGKKLILESSSSSKYTFRKIFGYDEKNNLVQTFDTVTIGTTLTPDPTVKYIRAEMKVSSTSDYIPSRGTADRAPAPILKKLRIRENEVLPVRALCPASERYAKAMCKWYDDNGYEIPYNRWSYSDTDFPVGTIMWWGRKTATGNYKYITHITLYIGSGYTMHATTGGMGLKGGQGIHINKLEDLFESYTEPLSGVASPEYHTNYDIEKELLGIQ